MTNIEIINIGNVDIGRKSLVCDFSISSEEFINRFKNLIEEDLPIDDIKSAIDNIGTKIKTDKNDRDILENFFMIVKEQPPIETTMGFSVDEKSEASQAEEMKSFSGDTETITYSDLDDSTEGIETYDVRTGKKEGIILLGEDGATGKLVPLEIIEKIEAHYKFNEEEDIEEDRKISGVFKVVNSSETNKIWDVDIDITKNIPISLDDHIAIPTLEANEEKTFEYNIEEYEKPGLQINEFISTLNDEETLSYSLSTSESNTVLFKITAKNIADYEMVDIEIKKEIQEGYLNVDIISSSLGYAETEAENEITWKIDKLDAGEEAELKINMTIDVESTEEKARTGKINAEYSAKKALTGIEIGKFDAYSDNFVGIEVLQKDNDPDKYDCSVIFSNESEFQMQLVNFDVIEAESGKGILDIDPSDVPIIASGATWKSNEWVSETKDGMEPRFYKTVEFFLISSRKISTLGSISIDDIELAVANIAGTIRYSVSELTSYRIVPFNVLHEIKNTGGTELNEVIFEETVQSGFNPPTADEIELYLVQPTDYEEEYDPDHEIDWNYLGDQISIDSSMIEITPNDQESNVEHFIKIDLSELKEDDIGMFKPGMLIRAVYPIKAYKPPKGSEFVSDVKLSANTFPAGAAINIIPEEVHIPVVHRRKRFIKGKKIIALSAHGEYEITLTIKNTGDSALLNVEIPDIVPDNFEYSDLSLETTKIESHEGKDMLIWNIEKIAENEKYEITYKIIGTEDARASDAQLSAN